MLKILRHKGVAKKIWWAVAIVIIISFSFFGTSYVMQDKQMSRYYAGKIFNKTISMQDFEKVFQQVEIINIIRYGEKFSQIKQFLNLEAQTWDRLMLLHEVDKKRIVILDSEVVATIDGYPFFQRDGGFDNFLYNDLLKFVFHTRARDFEESVRDTLRISKLLDEATSSIKITDEEVLAEFKRQYQKVQVSYTVVSSDTFKKEVSVSDQESKEYFDSNALNFRQPPSINTSYIELPFAAKATDADKTALKEKAQSLYDELKKNNDFQEFATKNNLTIKESGFINLDNPPLTLGWPFEFLNQIFEMKLNDISLPIETSKGFVIVKIVDQKEAFTPTFEDVKNKVADQLSKLKAKEIARGKALEYLNSIKAELDKTKLPDFALAVKAVGLEPTATPTFGRGEYLPQIGVSNEFQQAAFGLTDTNKLSDIVEIENGFAILYLDKYSEAPMDGFDKNKEAISKALLDERKNDAFNQFMTQIRLKANLEDNIAKLKEENKPSTP